MCGPAAQIRENMCTVLSHDSWACVRTTSIANSHVPDRVGDVQAESFRHVSSDGCRELLAPQSVGFGGGGGTWDQLVGHAWEPETRR